MVAGVSFSGYSLLTWGAAVSLTEALRLGASVVLPAPGGVFSFNLASSCVSRDSAREAIFGSSGSRPSSEFLFSI
jgi:hypothetical protein